MQLNGSRERGLALIITLLTMVVVAGIGTLLVARTVNELRHSGDDAAIVQTLLLARGGANLGGSLLASDIRDELDSIVNVRSSTTTCWSFGSGNCDQPGPTASSVAADLTGANSVATQLQSRIDALLCNANATSFGTGSAVRIRVYVTNTSCGEALPGNVTLPQGRFVAGDSRPANQDYAIPFVMVSEAELGQYRRNVVLQGEYRFQVGRVTFAQYALFTNVHRTGGGSGGSAVWFTENTLFDGPVHTNEYFRFYANPWFGHQVTSAGCPTNRRGTRTNPSTGNLEEYCTAPDYGAYFHNNPNTLRRNLGPNPSFGSNPVNRPELAGGVDWQSEYIPLPSNSYEQEVEALGAGIHFGVNQNLSRLRMWAGDADGNPPALVNGVWTPRTTHQYFEGFRCTNTSSGFCTSETPVARYRASENGVLEVLNSSGTWVQAYNQAGLPITDFNGVVFVDGQIERFGGPDRTSSSDPNTATPAFAHFSQITLATEGRVRITSDIKYEDPPCSSAPRRLQNGTVQAAECNNPQALNVFGLYTQSADVLIGNNNGTSSATRRSYNAPENIHIHGVLMSSTGRVAVEDYDQGSPRGTVNLIGGIIENYYGAFGTFNTRNGSMQTGYSRTFTYDQRMYSSVSPPYFPTIGLDRVKDVRVFSFGQREQVY